MKKHIVFYIILLLAAYNMAQAQCAFEQYHKIGSDHSITDCKIIEDVSSKSTFTFWGSTIDSASVTTVQNREIWIVKNDSCGNRLWKKNIGFSDISEDDFIDALVTPDSNILIVGYGEYTGQGGIYSCTVFKINREGTVLWKKAYGGRNGLVASSVVYNPYKHTYIISGRVERTGTRTWNRAYVFEVDSTGNMLKEQDIIINNDSITSDNYLQKMHKVVVLADSSIMGVITSQQADSVYLVKLTPNLDVSWIRKPFTNLFSTIRGVAMNVDFSEPKQQLAIYTGAEKIGDRRNGEWIIILDTAGIILKSDFITDVGTPNDGMCITNDGEYLIWGDYLMRLDENLNLKWNKTLSTDPNTRFTQVIQLKSGAYIGCGTSGERVNYEYIELFITQSHPNGSFVGLPETPRRTLSVNIYPNPSSGLFTAQELEEIENGKILVYDTYGKLVHQATAGSKTLDLTNQANGLYYIRIENTAGNVIARQAIMIQH